jgi:hypothetical protein
MIIFRSLKNKSIETIAIIKFNPEILYMIEEEQILGMFLNGLAFMTGNKVAEEARQKITKFKKHLGIISVGVWSIVIFIFVTRIRSS